MQPSSSPYRPSTQHLPLSPFSPANHAAHAIAHAIAKRKPFAIPHIASTASKSDTSHIHDFESLRHENRRLKLGLRQSREKTLLLQTKTQRLEAEVKRRDRHIEVLLTNNKKPAALVSTPLRQEVHKIRQHQERSAAIKSLQQELTTLRSTVTSLKEKTRSPKAQTLAELMAERDEYLAEVMYLRDALQEITATEAERTEAAATIGQVVPSVTSSPAAATEAEKAKSMTTVAGVVPHMHIELAATTTSEPYDVSTTLSPSSAPAEEGGAAALRATTTPAPPTNEKMERGILQPSPLRSSSSLPSSSSSVHIPKYSSSSQSLPVRPQQMIRDSIVFSKPIHLEGTKLGSISEDENDMEDGEGETVTPVLLEEEEEDEEEEEKREEAKEEEGGAQTLTEERFVTSNVDGLVMVKENEQEKNELEEEGACLSTCSLYLSQLSSLSVPPGQAPGEEGQQTLEESRQQNPCLMTMAAESDR
eukprot:evm.model.NODE_7421_length_28612_cov_28.772577.5